MPQIADVFLSKGPNRVLPDIATLLLRLGFSLTTALTHGRGTLAGFRADPSAYPDPLGLGSEASMALMVFTELGCALTRRSRVLVRLIAGALVMSGCAPRNAAIGPDVTLDSFHRAESLVRQALDSMGGLESLRRAGGLTLEGRGRFDLTARMQGMHAEKPDWVPLTEAFAIDLTDNRVAFEMHARVNPDADEWIRFVHDDHGRMLIVLRESDRAFWVPGSRDHRRRYMRIAPQPLLQDALDQRATLRYLGRHDGREVVSFVLATGEPISLHIDPETGLLGGFEYLLDLPVLGDTSIAWQYEDYRPVSGLGVYPSGYRVLCGGRVLKEVHYDTVRAGTTDAAVLKAPPGIEIPAPPAAPEQTSKAEAASPPKLPKVQALADGVHLAMNVRGGFHVLFVELADYVVVVDAPAGYHELQMVPAVDWAGDVTSSSVGRRLLEAIRKTVPDKPVRYVVLTHHHGDHAGGIRPFLAAGATVLTTAETRAVVERAAGGTFRLEPDELGNAPQELRIEVVEGERTLSDGVRSVRILDVGPNPHAEGMLAVYLSKERIL